MHLAKTCNGLSSEWQPHLSCKLSAWSLQPTFPKLQGQIRSLWWVLKEFYNIISARKTSLSSQALSTYILGTHVVLIQHLLSYFPVNPRPWVLVTREDSESRPFITTIQEWTQVDLEISSAQNCIVLFHTVSFSACHFLLPHAKINMRNIPSLCGPQGVLLFIHVDVLKSKLFVKVWKPTQFHFLTFLSSSYPVCCKTFFFNETYHCPWNLW